MQIAYLSLGRRLAATAFDDEAYHSAGKGFETAHLRTLSRRVLKHDPHLETFETMCSLDEASVAFLQNAHRTRI